ncbi:MAG: ABC transporter ATP-binding protein [Anaerolineae bacterium]|nr:ABC transporter ATP-binding protein [Anaerolineae bacterium]
MPPPFQTESTYAMPYLELRGIRKTYPGGVLANDDITLSVEQGEIHGLVGENGAGKSTLMKILYGMEQPDHGEILLAGRSLKIANPHAAIQLGIGMVHQHFQLVPNLTVAENIALGAEPRKGLFADQAAMHSRVRALSERFGLQVDPAARVSDLSVGLQQRVEILKMLYRDARLLILDEPSAVLTPQEVESLFSVLRRLVAEGCTAIFITHKLYEIMSICERATVLRRGRVVGSVRTAESSPAEISRLMVGHDVASPQRTPPNANPRDRLVVRALTTGSAHRSTPLDFTIRSGEILGVAGVEGNGQSELIEALLGVRTGVTGDIVLDGTSLSRLNARRRREKGLALIPEDRNREGLSRPMQVWENLASATYYRSARASVLDLGGLQGAARDLIRRFDIRVSSEKSAVSTLSGGNAQKVVIARELAESPAVLIAAQPTRGLDVGAAQFVHEQLLNLRREGVGILLISADLDELLALSDRLIVMFEGRILATFQRDAATRQALGLAMAGRLESEDAP